ncbi:MAG: nitrogen regulation protein NR(II) [Granulosicoccus sp.]
MNSSSTDNSAIVFAMLDAMATAVIAVDDNLRVMYLNNAAEQLLGVSANKAIYQRLNRLVTIPDALFTRMRHSSDTGQPFTDRQVTIEPHGQEPQLVDLYLSPHRSIEQNMSMVLEINAVDRPLRIARDEAMLAQQEHARSLLRSLAHEIKNPLGGLRGAAQLLSRQWPDKELVEYTTIIIREADRLQNLIDRMLGPVSRPRREPVNLHEVLEHVRKIISASAPEGVSVSIDYDPSIPECLSDRDRLVQVVLNIAVNALEALQTSGQIVFRTRVVHNYTIGGTLNPLVANIEIRDTGPGVPDHLIDQIFFPMVTGTDHGTGLGLSIAQSMMNQLGGLIECRSEPGETIFTVLIPLEIP